MRTPSLLACCGLLASAALGQGQLSYLEGPASGALTLWTVPETSPTAAPTAVLTQVELVDAEITLRTPQHAARPDWPRRVVRNGAARIELPGGGRLLRYRLMGGARYGVLWIRPSGAPEVLLERPGGFGNTDPFADRFAVAFDGRFAAFTSVLGDALWLARLDGQPFAGGALVRSVPVPSGLVEAQTVCAGATHLFFQTDDTRQWRTTLLTATAPENVTPAGPGTELVDSVTMSADGSTLVFLFGQKKSTELYLVRGTGPTLKLLPPPADYEDPTYMPESETGPELLLNDDGTRLFYVDSTIRDELYLLDTSTATPPVHITSDANFQPYIGISIFPSFLAGSLTIGVGDLAAFDWFAVTTGAGQVANLTQTAGNQKPFPAGTLVPRGGYLLSSGLVVSEEVNAGQLRLRWFDATSGTGGVSGGPLRARLQFGEGVTSNLLVPGTFGDRLLTPSLAPIVQGPAGILLGPDLDLGGLSVFTASLPGGPGAVVFALAGGGLVATPADASLREVTATAGGGVLINGTDLQYVAPGAAAVLGTQGAIVRIVVS